jgi:hypothetical protein
MSDKNWIAGAVKNKGALHKSLGIKEGHKISESRLDKACHSKSPKIRKEASLAKTLRSFRHKSR